MAGAYTNGFEDVKLADFSTGSTDTFKPGGGLVVLVNRQEVVPHNCGLLVLELAAGLKFDQAAGQHTIGTGDGHGLIALHRAQLTTLLTGDVNLLLSLCDGCALKFIQRKQIGAAGNVERIDSFKTGDNKIYHNGFLLIYLWVSQFNVSWPTLLGSTVPA